MYIYTSSYILTLKTLLICFIAAYFSTSRVPYVFIVFQKKISGGTMRFIPTKYENTPFSYEKFN